MFYQIFNVWFVITRGSKGFTPILNILVQLFLSIFILLTNIYIWISKSKASLGTTDHGIPGEYDRSVGKLDQSLTDQQHSVLRRKAKLWLESVSPKLLKR